MTKTHSTQFLALPGKLINWMMLIKAFVVMMSWLISCFCAPDSKNFDLPLFFCQSFPLLITCLSMSRWSRLWRRRWPRSLYMKTAATLLHFAVSTVWEKRCFVSHGLMLMFLCLAFALWHKMLLIVLILIVRIIYSLPNWNWLTNYHAVVKVSLELLWS